MRLIKDTNIAVSDKVLVFDLETAEYYHQKELTVPIDSCMFLGTSLKRLRKALPVTEIEEYLKDDLDMAISEAAPGLVTVIIFMK